MGLVAGSSPVLGLTSKKGKLLLEISTRMRWPALKRLATPTRSIVTLRISPGFSSVRAGASSPAPTRMMRSARFMANPRDSPRSGGATSTSLAVKSVSGAEEEIQRSTRHRSRRSPRRRRGAAFGTPGRRAGKTRGGRCHSRRSSTRHRWSRGPSGEKSLPESICPPMVGTGCRGRTGTRLPSSLPGSCSLKLPSPCR